MGYLVLLIQQRQEHMALRHLWASLAALAAAMTAGDVGAVEAGARGPWTTVQTSRVRLVAGRTAQGDLVAGIELQLVDGWKTYWRTPGDSGVPPAFDWAGSTNLQAVTVKYPPPSRIPEPGGISLGYKRSVVFPVEIVPRSSGEPIDLRLAMDYGICRDICIPAEVKLSLAIPADAGPIDIPLAQALETVPRSLADKRSGDPDVVRIEVVRNTGQPTLVIDGTFPGGAAQADLLIEAPDGLFLAMAHKDRAQSGDNARFTVDLTRGSDPKELSGKALVLTLVGAKGASERKWTFK